MRSHQLTTEGWGSEDLTWEDERKDTEAKAEKLGDDSRYIRSESGGERDRPSSISSQRL